MDNKRQITITLEIHAYAEEKLCDDHFNPPNYGLYGPELMSPLAERRNGSFSFTYDETTCLSDVICATKTEIWGSAEYKPMAPVSYSFFVDGERLFIDDGKKQFLEILKKYVDPDQTGTITVCVLISCDAGLVARGEKLRYFVHSREAGNHKSPHIHVTDNGHNYEASIRISDGEIIAGSLPADLAKLAKKKILSDQKFFYECWNTKTDGLQVDINHHYGLISY